MKSQLSIAPFDTRTGTLKAFIRMLSREVDISPVVKGVGTRIYGVLKKNRLISPARLYFDDMIESRFLGMFAPRSGANIPKNSAPFPIL
jgi:hypothetical protein